jgi:hypothetical protein
MKELSLDIIDNYLNKEGDWTIRLLNKNLSSPRKYIFALLRLLYTSITSKKKITNLHRNLFSMLKKTEKQKEVQMNRKLWVVSVVYVIFVALPSSIITGVTGALGGQGWVGFIAFVGLCGLYATTLLLLMGLIDYARH